MTNNLCWILSLTQLITLRAVLAKKEKELRVLDKLTGIDQLS